MVEPFIIKRFITLMKPLSFQDLLVPKVWFYLSFFPFYFSMLKINQVRFQVQGKMRDLIQRIGDSKGEEFVLHV